MLAPVGFTIARVLDFVILTPAGLVYFHAVTIPYGLVATVFPIVPVVYYLVWKHLVGFFNKLLGIT